MAYYNDVRFCTTKSTYKKLMDMLPDDIKEHSYLFSNGAPEVYKEYGNDVVFGWDFVKWYDDDSVSCVEDAYYTLLNDGHNIEFVRVGGDEGDIEECTYLDCDEELGVHIGTITKIEVYC